MASNTFKFSGTGVAIVTPFRSDDSIDFTALRNLVDFQIKNKIDYLVVLGTTGESVTLSADEKRAVVDTVLEAANGRVPIVVGIGGNNTQDIINKIKHFDFTGIDAILSVSPYYNKPTQNGLYEHYKAIASTSPVPIILYNIPGRTGSNMCAETTLRLANDFKNIVAIKEASGMLNQIMEIIKGKPSHFEVISGDDLLALPIIALGGKGVISVVANAYPLQMSELIRLALAGKIEEARKIHYSLLTIINLLFAEGNPAGIKATLEIKKLTTAHVRLPLVKVSQATYAKIEEQFKLLK
ncbi:MAG TPA: 4-hydroxy-tetrahydrodipicolinate synthase [Bacteroidales bacterium]|nr:4-hydroxy-tetrahydrodipicolinate synthase [Bacteroidales bacterium]HPO66038.1 4-hydroxy-tetrahydrodipicolinate synthase [Bacteroidales bacterium]